MPVFTQVQQEQIAAGETTENISEIHGVPEQVIVQGNSELSGFGADTRTNCGHYQFGERADFYHC